MIVVTGGAGFIGANIARALSIRDNETIALCDVLGTDNKWQNLGTTVFDYFIHPHELMEFLQQHNHEIDAIIHMGAISSTTETNADLMVSNNFNLTLNLFDWCAEHHKRLIYASSAATYGDGLQGFDDDESFNGLQQLTPLNVYGWSKHQVDLAIARRKTHKRPQPRQCVGLKFFNVYGAFEDHKAGQKSVVNQIYRMISLGNPARLFKSYHADFAHGEQKRDFIWVQDCVDITLWLLDNPQVNGLYNVGTGQARSFNDLAHATFTAIDHPSKIEYIDMPDILQERYQYYTAANMTKLRIAGYVKSFTTLEEGVQRYVQDYLIKNY